MGMFDTFIDQNRNRTSQCKAFDRMLDVYYVRDRVKIDNFPLEMVKDKENIHIDSLLPFQFIHLSVFEPENSVPFAIFEGIEDTGQLTINDFTHYKTLYLDYYGKPKKMTPERYSDIQDMGEVWTYIVDNVHIPQSEIKKLPFLYAENYKEGHLCNRCNEKRTNSFYEYWNNLMWKKQDDKEEEQDAI